MFKFQSSNNNNNNSNEGKVENVNCIYLNNLEIEEVKEFENNKYREYFLKVKLIKIKEVL